MFTMNNEYQELFLYNSASRSKELFRPLKEGFVGMYSCGPTVYNFPHIGNYRAYLAQDFAARVLKYNGYDVTHVMNITDVDDKTIRDSRAAGKSLATFTREFTAAFLQDLSDLNITTITYHPKATLHIQEMIELISSLLAKGIAYQADDGSVYFSISRFPYYGSLSHIDAELLRSGASGRVDNDEYSKDNVQDFALWKAWDEEDGSVAWESPFGKGRPGWHIECSAMSMKYLGNHFDIHSGGIDLLFPHHENEIAQSQAASGEPFVNYWLHNEWLLVDGKKMAKRLGNFTTLRDLIAQDYEPLAYRFFCLSAHYRQSLNFTFKALDSAQQGYVNLRNDILRIAEHASQNQLLLPSEKLKEEITSYESAFHQALNDDMNAPQALAHVFDFIRHIHATEKIFSSADYRLCFDALLKWDEALGLGLSEIQPDAIPDDVRALARERDLARLNNDWEQADAIRRAIEERGYVIEDARQGTRIVKI